MTTYVYGYGANLYHWRRECSEYPDDPHGATKVRPSEWLCRECKAIERKEHGEVMPEPEAVDPALSRSEPAAQTPS